MNETKALIAILICAAVTALLRALPFLFFGGKRKTPALILSLGKVLPPAIMAMLVVYCLRGVTFTAFSGWVPALIASAAVVGLHLWKRQTLLSILGGTAVYMILVQFVFI